VARLSHSRYTKTYLKQRTMMPALLARSFLPVRNAGSRIG